MRETLPRVGSIWLGLLVTALGAQTCRGQQEIRVKPSAENVGKYEKVEFRTNSPPPTRPTRPWHPINNLGQAARGETSSPAFGETGLAKRRFLAKIVYIVIG